MLLGQRRFCSGIRNFVKNAESILQAEVGAVFEQVLCDAGVFKRNEAGKATFLRFLQLFA